MAGSLIVREPVFIEENGQRVAVILPIAAYEALLAGHVAFPDRKIDAEGEALLREQKAFETMHPDLLARYPGQYVAVLGGKVIDHDENQYELWIRTHNGFPEMPVLIKPIFPDPVERYKRRSPRLAYE